jgi:hypothetical protein
MVKKATLYVDIVSPFGYIAYHLTRVRPFEILQPHLSMLRVHCVLRGSQTLQRLNAFLPFKYPDFRI